MKKANTALRAIKRKSVGSKESGAKEKDQEDLETEEKLTQELLSTAHQQYNEAVGATYELLRNLLAGKPQTQWDRIVQEMHERDSWAGADGKKHDGSAQRVSTPFWTAWSCISSPCLPPTQPKGSGTTSSREYVSPKGLLYVSLSPEWKF